MDESILRNLIISDNDSLQKIRSYYFSIQALIFTVMTQFNENGGSNVFVVYGLIFILGLINFLWHTHENNYLAKIDYLEKILVNGKTLAELKADSFYCDYFSAKKIKRGGFVRTTFSILPLMMFGAGTFLILGEKQYLCLFG